MADKYRRVEKAQENLPANELRVRRGVGIGRYLRRAVELLNGNEHEGVVIKGVSNAMESAVKLAELIKHRVKRLYQVTKIANITIVDEYEPLEEGLDQLKFERIVTMLTIELSKSPLDRSEIGYQDPIPESEVQEYDVREQGERGPRPEGGYRGRGGYRGGSRGESRGGFRGGFRGGDREGGYGGERREGGYRQGGYEDRGPRQSYGDRENTRGGPRGGFRGDRGGPRRGYGERRPYGERRDYNERREDQN